MEQDHIRIGHSLGDRHVAVDEDSLDHAVRIVTGEAALSPRDPVDESAVHGAEEVLGAEPRPIYAFVGDLHPDLGSIGLVLSRAWAGRALQGVTRCDSGGLFAGRGRFEHIERSSRADALRALSSPQGLPLAVWDSLFAEEIGQSYERGARGYVDGDAPDCSVWDDIRAHCITAARTDGGRLDRRLWTWELRMHDAPSADDFEALVLSHDAQKRLNDLVTRERIALPDQVEILASTVGEHLVDHWFSTPAVRRALLPTGETDA